MSQNPWPLFLVGLGSLGFLAASMAQQSPPNNLPNGTPPASLQFPDFEDLDFDRTSGDSGNRWSTANAAAGDTSAQPSVRLGGNIDEFTPASGSGYQRRVRDSRRSATEALGRQRDSQPATAQIGEIQTGSRQRRDSVAPQSAVITEPLRRRFTERSVPAVDRSVEKDAGRPLFDTREAAILSEPPGVISANRSVVPAGKPERTAPKAPSMSEPERPTQDSASESQPKIQQDGTTEPAGSFPLWSSMALIASFAANLFFCWIAWDAHSKYQDLIEDMSESETRLERQTRRRRHEDDRPRRSRAEESEFLRASVDGYSK